MKKTSHFVKRTLAVAICASLQFSFNAIALTPLPDTRPEFYIGEWIGLGPSASFCRMSLQKAGAGVIRVQTMNGTIVEIKIEKWANRNQSFQVLASSAPVEVKNQMNGTFSISTSGAECQMARADQFNGFLSKGSK